MDVRCGFTQALCVWERKSVCLLLGWFSWVRESELCTSRQIERTITLNPGQWTEQRAKRERKQRKGDDFCCNIIHRWADKSRSSLNPGVLVNCCWCSFALASVFHVEQAFHNSRRSSCSREAETKERGQVKVNLVKLSGLTYQSTDKYLQGNMRQASKREREREKHKTRWRWTHGWPSKGDRVKVVS